jgi:polyisoprenoid-binding protein YceI
MKKYSIIILLSIAAFTSLSAQQQWKVDSQNSQIKFKIKNFGLWVNGTFSGLQASIKFDPSNLSGSSITASVESKTVNTELGMRDDHLRKDDFFDVEKYPNIKFVSKLIRKNKDQLEVIGDLYIKSAVRSVTIPFTFKESGNTAVFNGTFEIKRTDFGIGGKGGTMNERVYLELNVLVIK